MVIFTTSLILLVLTLVIVSLRGTKVEREAVRILNENPINVEVVQYDYKIGIQDLMSDFKKHIKSEFNKYDQDYKLIKE